MARLVGANDMVSRHVVVRTAPVEGEYDAYWARSR
jgi:hypothetical protein